MTQYISFNNIDTGKQQEQIWPGNYKESRRINKDYKWFLFPGVIYLFFGWSETHSQSTCTCIFRGEEKVNIAKNYLKNYNNVN